MIDLVETLPGSVYYIDPGTGSLVIQVLIASILGGLILLRIYWGKLKDFLSRFRKRR